jgi:phosphoacetylglucosamine mutase
MVEFDIYPNAQNVVIACTSTGVKHLHHKAQEFDIGIYFEANGHGTVLFSNRASETFKMASEDAGLPDTARNAGRQLLALTELINQSVGDSISDLLMVEVILLLRGVS